LVNLQLQIDNTIAVFLYVAQIGNDMWLDFGSVIVCWLLSISNYRRL